MQIPPLRQRREDIPLLVKHFMVLHGTEGEAPREITDEAMDALRRYDWPGNVRELENCIERICALSARSLIGLGDLPDQVVGAAEAGATLNLSGYKQDVERQAILEALERAGGNRSAAAKLLGLGRSTLYRKLERLGIPTRPRRG
jgi:DNA-binding NtrC family response regulator